MKTITYDSPIKLTEDTWKYAPNKKKVQLLKTMGFHKSWAKTKTIPEMVNRGGGMTAKALLGLNQEYLNRKGGKVTINWNLK